MHTVNAYAPPVVASFTRSKDLSVVSTTENSSPGLPALYSGEASSHLGDALAAGSLLICLFVVALATPLQLLIRQEPAGSKYSRSTSIHSQEKKRTGGTERGQYEES